MATEKAPKATAAKPAKTTPKSPAKESVQASESSAASVSVNEAGQGKSKSKEATLEINGKFYNLSELSPEAKGNVQSIQFADQEVRRLSMMLSMAKTARAAYRTALLGNLPPEAK